jgi:hypothetical protein
VDIEMATFFVEIPPSSVSEDARWPDLDGRHIYEHLKYFCSRPSPFPLPAIKVIWVDGHLVVTTGHKYLRIACELGKKAIRVMIAAETLEQLNAALPSGARVIDKEELRQEEAIKVSPEYHVFFFEEPLDAVQQQRFLDEIAGFFLRLNTSLIKPNERQILQHAFGNNGKSAEFQALIPVGDHSWLDSYIATCRRFSNGVKKIVSFQGAQFQ